MQHSRKSKHSFSSPLSLQHISIFRFLLLFWLFAVIILSSKPVFSGPLDKVITQWEPYLEWSIDNPSFSGNPFDLIATVTFTHELSGETHITEMFYGGGTAWNFRFTGTKLGIWNFISSSSDTDLDSLGGSVEVLPNNNPQVTGFVRHQGNKWAKQVGSTGELQAFVPQLVMINGPQGYFNNATAVDYEIDRFIHEHGFNGFHMPVTCRWAELEEQKCTEVDNSDPDLRTFAALELVISKTHAAGGMVHLWMWGDESRRWTPTVWGINGIEDKRIQRYIAARLGPLPGWTMGYGFDNWEWVSTSQLQVWHSFMNDHLGWSHFLGARATKNTLEQLYEGLDYSGYEQHRPDYDKYVETIDKRPEKPSFSEDRFRVRQGSHAYKDYTHEMIRRGLWHSTMAGGVANIWGDLSQNDGANSGTDTSASFPHPEWVKTNALFFKDRFQHNLLRCNGLTDGVCLQSPDKRSYMFYKEETSSIRLNLSAATASMQAIAVDTTRSYKEIKIGVLKPRNQTWGAPYASDWAISLRPAASNPEPPSSATSPAPMLHILLDDQ